MPIDCYARQIWIGDNKVNSLGGCRSGIWTYFRAFRWWGNRVRYRWLRVPATNAGLLSSSRESSEANRPSISRPFSAGPMENVLDQASQDL